MQAGNDACRGHGIVERPALGNFEHQLPETDRRLAEDRLHVLDNADVAEMPLEQVDGDLHVRDGLGQIAQIVPYLLHQRHGHGNGEARDLGIVDEGAGRYHLPIPLLPATQHFAPHKRAGAQIDHRLVIGLDLVPLDRPLQVKGRHAGPADIAQVQQQEGGAGNAGDDGEDHVEIGIARPHHGEGHRKLHLDGELPGIALGADIVRARRPPVKSRRIADRHDGKAIGQRHPHHRGIGQCLRQSALGLSQ
ncbi:hypothetical protein D9M68_781370 [compost metagenome]